MDDNGNDYVVWTDYRNNNADAYFAKVNTVPEAPQNLSVTQGSGNHPLISWDANIETDLQGYHVYRENANSVVTQLTSNPITGTSYLDTDMEYGWATNVWYFAKAIDDADQLSAASNKEEVWVVPSSDRWIVESMRNVIPDQYKLLANHPNPFNPTTQIAYQLPKQSRVTLTIYDLRGNRIAKVVDGVKAAAFYQFQWDGTNRQGQAIASGTYLYRLEARSLEDD